MTEQVQTIDDLKADIEELEEEKEELQSELDNFELDIEDYTEQYNNMLDECYGDFMNYPASMILERVDPIAHRCGLNDYVDGIDVRELDEYKEIETRIEEIALMIEDMESEIEKIEEAEAQA
jgi:DNA repair exonuclease SbcCD ATPase subunit